MQQHSASVSRRDLLLALAGAAGMGLPLQFALASQPPSAQLARKHAILFRLHGGNDALNTLIPYRDPLYRALRPTLALSASTLLPVSDELALHPSLTGLMKLFAAGEVAIVQDVGYPHPNLSHFESAAIWDSANTEPGSIARGGWWGESVNANRAAFDAVRFDAAAVTFDKDVAFASGRGVPVLLANQDVATTLGTKGQRSRVTPDAPETARAIAEMINQGIEVRARVAQRLENVQPPEWAPYEDSFAIQTKLTSWLLAHGVTTPLLRVYQDGFDTHSQLLQRHDALMKAFDSGLLDLKQGLQVAGVWDDTVIVVHSEFGRRPAENGYGGTDHGTAGPVLLIGGKVRGGVYGRRAALDDLDADGNTKFTTDFRAVYSTLLEHLWALPSNPFAAQGFAPLSLPLA